VIFHPFLKVNGSRLKTLGGFSAEFIRALPCPGQKSPLRYFFCHLTGPAANAALKVRVYP
jgi:hypothetical protein